jgi:hypothetical protein
MEVAVRILLGPLISILDFTVNTIIIPELIKWLSEQGPSSPTLTTWEFNPQKPYDKERTDANKLSSTHIHSLTLSLSLSLSLTHTHTNTHTKGNFNFFNYLLTVVLQSNTRQYLYLKKYLDINNYP